MSAKRSPEQHAGKVLLFFLLTMATGGFIMGWFRSPSWAGVGLAGGIVASFPATGIVLALWIWIRKLIEKS